MRCPYMCFYWNDVTIILMTQILKEVTPVKNCGSEGSPNR